MGKYFWVLLLSVFLTFTLSGQELFFEEFSNFQNLKEIDWRKLSVDTLHPVRHANLVAQMDKFQTSNDEIYAPDGDTCKFLSDYLFLTDLNHDGKTELVNRGFSMRFCGRTRIFQNNSIPVELSEMMGVVISLKDTLNCIEVKTKIDNNAGEDFYEGIGFYRLDKKTFKIKNAQFLFWQEITEPVPNFQAEKIKIPRSTIVWNSPPRLKISKNEWFYRIQVAAVTVEQVGFKLSSQTLASGEKWELVCIPISKTSTIVDENASYLSATKSNKQFVIGWIEL